MSASQSAEVGSSVDRRVARHSAEAIRWTPRGWAQSMGTMMPVRIWDYLGWQKSFWAIHRFPIKVVCGLTYAVLKMIKLVVWLVFFAHWQACLWGLISSFMADAGQQNWLSEFRADWLLDYQQGLVGYRKPSAADAYAVAPLYQRLEPSAPRYVPNYACVGER